MINEFETLIKARYPSIAIVSPEEPRIVAHLSGVEGVAVVRWTITKGFQVLAGDAPFPKCQKPIEALQALEKYDGALIAILPDFHAFTSDAVVVRAMRDTVEAFRTGDHPRTLVTIGASAKVPTEIERYTAIIDWALPTREDIRALAERASESGGSAEKLDAIVDSALGLTLIECENAFAKSIASHRDLDPSVIQSEKKQIIRKSGLLEYVDTEATLETIGGLDGLKAWLRQRRNAFSTEAREAGLLPPRGMIVVGPAGTGKSLVAKATGAAYRLPLLKLDLGKVYQGLVGSSEENMRKVLSTVEAVAPCVLWIDEIEKGFAGSSGQGDSGTSSRVFGSFLTWMQEKKASVFVVATSNDITGLPPELLRKGRFDEIFFVDLPTASEREVIYQIHISRVCARVKSPRVTDGNFDVARLAKDSDGFTGAEIEQVINEALYAAFDAGEHLTTAHVDAARAACVPLSHSMAPRIDAIREWASANARSAATVVASKRVTKGRFN